jgi:hypothetical protein
MAINRFFPPITIPFILVLQKHDKRRAKNQSTLTTSRLTVSTFNLGATKYKTSLLETEIKGMFSNTDIIVFTEANSLQNRRFLEEIFQRWKFLWEEIRTKDYIGIFINEKKNGIKIGGLVKNVVGGFLVVPLYSGNFKFHLVAAHLRWKGNRSLSRELCFKTMKAYNNTICVGDLNIEPNEILDHHDFDDTRFNISFTRNDPETTITRGRKDNILYQNIFKLKQKTVGNFFSDHFPIQTTLEYPKST